jgi:hypothetical protein
MKPYSYLAGWCDGPSGADNKISGWLSQTRLPTFMSCDWVAITESPLNALRPGDREFRFEVGYGK